MQRQLQKPPENPMKDPAIERACDQVMSALGIASRRKRRLIRQAILLETEKGEPAPTTALAMIAAVRKKAEQEEFLRPCGLERFIGEGLWLDERRWPWDKDALRDARRMAGARVGSL